MKKWTFIIMIVMGLFLVVHTASGGDAELEAYYNDYLSKKIQNCKGTASAFDTCYNERMAELVEMRTTQADFYEKNREELVNAMISNNVGRNTPKIDYFLIKQMNNQRQFAHGEKPY